MEKAKRCLEITIISAEGLRLNGRSVKKNTFVIVRIDSDNQRLTRMDKEGGSYPSWNEKLELPLPLPPLSNSVQLITVEVQCKTSLGVRSVGTSKIPTSDFMGDYTPPQYLHFLSYRLRDRNGERNGIINFSVRTIGSQSIAAAWPVLPPTPLIFPATGNQKINAVGGSGSGSGSALGVPVSVPYKYGNRHGYRHGYGHGYGV
ncbi:BON1-associated protein 1-like [Telopea speciosissima]|uniref:BON1-associated protein 1-like n=1 Tax=Telopea speciosissima TaxID=54955 RepID=UPI001CC3C1A5|nr:BON1-associated protein 1-like [Telopea speciosissima]